MMRKCRDCGETYIEPKFNKDRCIACKSKNTYVFPIDPEKKGKNA